MEWVGGNRQGRWVTVGAVDGWEYMRWVVENCEVGEWEQAGWMGGNIWSG